MKSIKSSGILIGCVLALMFLTGDGGTALSMNDDRSELNAMIQRMDQCLTRLQLVRESMASVQENQIVVEMSESLTATAEQVKGMMQRSQELLTRRNMMSDPQMENDVRGIRTQLEYLAGTMENLLQYLEHLTYRLDQQSRHS